MGARPARIPASHARRGWLRSAARIIALSIAIGLLPGCGATASPSAVPASTRAHVPSATPTSTPADTPASFCDAQDTPIPGAASALANDQLNLPNLTAVKQAWFQMYATMVPACSEITPNPLPVQTKNLTGGQVTDAALATWVQLDSTLWALWEWAGQHAQYDFMRFLLPTGNNVTAFIEQGGKVVDETAACEYPIKVYAMIITADEMSEFTGARISTPGVAYALTWAGPCITEWTSATGQVTDYPIGAGQEYQELEITETKTAPALGDYLEMEASVNSSAGADVASILAESGV
ncbi:MAG: hypothetical protein ABSC16_01690 [Candidatus Dormibacteria bacterium]|jgi:hypothetical protein